MPLWLLKIRTVIGKIADVLIAGRAAGLWSKDKGPDIKPKP
jgi:hypothetical protein